MARGSTEIETVRQLKAAYDDRVRTIDADARAKKELAKQDVIAGIHAALAAGASQNAVATKGMGYAGLSPLRSFLGAGSQKIDALLAASAQAGALPAPSRKYTFTQDSTNPNVYHFIDVNGKKDNIWVMGDVPTLYWDLTDDAQNVFSEFYAEFKDKFNFTPEDVERIEGSK